MATGKVFFLSQAASVLEMSASLITNWTIGRPLRIVPQLSAVGTGSRNLYGVDDLCKFSFAHQLSMDGYAPGAIQPILDSFGEEFASLEFAVVTSGGPHHGPKPQGLQVQLIPKSQFDRDGWQVIEEAVRSSFGCYVLHISLIVEDVNQRVDKFLQKTTGKRGRQSPSQRPLSPQVTAYVEGGGEKFRVTRKFRKPEQEKGQEERINARGSKNR
jgi:hypothetical protein